MTILKNQISASLKTPPSLAFLKHPYLPIKDEKSFGQLKKPVQVAFLSLKSPPFLAFLKHPHLPTKDENSLILLNKFENKPSFFFKKY